MAIDDLAFDAYDRLVGRNSLAESPVSLVVRGANESTIDRRLERCQALLGKRRHPDEIILAFSREPVHRPSSRLGRLLVRTVVHPDVDDRQGLEWLLANARWPVTAFVGAEAELPIPAFAAMLEALVHADVVIGRRRHAKGLRHPAAWLTRRAFGVATSDPLSPYFAVRRETAAGIPLELGGTLASFELLAKLTFAFAIYDEVEVDLPDSETESLHRVLWARRSDLKKLFQRPTFWNREASSRRFRTTPQETKPSSIDETAPATMNRRRTPHPLHRLPSAGPPAFRELPGSIVRR